ncbi:MAG TPA: alpha/beta hydrolase [Acidimicrobiales bacterium]|jgi:pimeloyl-ACP methyl ester carboxylesterase|nr:alpha/beta hydrolase [Acidimicrobiales bacterium]
MERFTSFDGTAIAYVTAGAADGPDVLLLHGFAADHRLNWVAPGVVDALVDAGHHVIALDARGHGQSDKPREPSAYEADAMPRDAQALLDHLDVETVDIVGYSMGSVVSSRLVPMEPRTRRLVLGGVGAGLVTGNLPRADIADGLLADDPATIEDPTARAFRMFADSTGADRHSLWAIQKAGIVRQRTPIGDIRVPTLVLVGRDDVLVGPPEPLAAAISGARVEVVEGDHLSAVVDPAFSKAIIDFLA